MTSCSGHGHHPPCGFSVYLLPPQEVAGTFNWGERARVNHWSGMVSFVFSMFDSIRFVPDIITSPPLPVASCGFRLTLSERLIDGFSVNAV